MIAKTTFVYTNSNYGPWSIPHIKHSIGDVIPIVNYNGGAIGSCKINSISSRLIGSGYMSFDFDVVNCDMEFLDTPLKVLGPCANTVSPSLGAPKIVLLVDI